MEKKLSRAWARLSVVLMVLGVLVMLVLHRYVLGLLGGFVLLAVGYGVQFFLLRCPACHKGYAAPQWKRSGTQRCTKCGHVFEYDK